MSLPVKETSERNDNVTPFGSTLVSNMAQELMKLPEDKRTKVLYNLEPKRTAQRFHRIEKIKNSIARARSSTYLHGLTTHFLRLPRELRDIVYAQLWNRTPPPINDILWPTFGTNREAQWKQKCPGPPCTCLRRLPHFMDLNIVGHQVAREVLESCQKTAADLLYPYVVSGEELESFATHDVFHVGITREQLFREMNLEVQFNDVIFDRWEEEEEWREKKDKITAQLESAVKYLLKMPFKEPRKVTFNLKHFATYPINLSYVLQILGPAFCDMRDKGFTMEFKYDHRELVIDWEFGVEVWDWMADEWRLNMRQFHDVDVVGLTRGSRDLDYMSSWISYMIERHLAEREPYWKTIRRIMYAQASPKKSATEAIEEH